MTAPAAPFPLLIAVTGAPGASKTTLLATLAAARMARDQRVEGVLAIAHGRTESGRGAGEYWLRIVGGERELPWITRDESLDPPYRFEAETGVVLRSWAEQLRTLPPSPLLLLDEFGKFELRGHGLMPLWPELLAAEPQIVVIAVRAGLVGEIETLLGRKFDVQVEAAAPDALARLLRACDDFGEWTRLGLYGGAAGAAEVTLGSALHAAKVPFTGLMMSSLQCAMMVYAGSGTSIPGRVVWVPFISGGLKALSPAGSRVRPMIAILMQGLLFGGAVQGAGWNFLGIGLGGALVGMWAALQGFALQYLLIGNEMVKAYDAVVLWIARHFGVTPPGLPWLVGAWAAVHALAACALALTAWRLRRPPAMLQRIIDQEKARPRHDAGLAGVATPWTARWREFARWQFWLPLAVVAGVLAGTGTRWETIAWMIARFVAVTFVLMALLSLLQPVRWAERLRRFGWWGPALAMSQAIGRRPAAVRREVS